MQSVPFIVSENPRDPAEVVVAVPETKIAIDFILFLVGLLIGHFSL